jgi:signal transduction histidine kinase
LETSLPSNLPRVLGDEAALAEAFAHLVANAAEASADRNKPRITLSAKPVREGRHPAAVVVTVRDNGSGISPEIKEKIFFTVLHDQTARNGSRSADRETNGI